MFDNQDCEALGETARSHNRWEFMLVVGPLRVEGGAGSPTNPIAIFRDPESARPSAAPDPPCALFDPTTNSWSQMASVNYRKQYHSVALLLPNGKVMATGGSGYGGGSNVIEIFSPPYLFHGPRPVINSASVRSDSLFLVIGNPYGVYCG